MLPIAEGLLYTISTFIVPLIVMRSVFSIFFATYFLLGSFLPKMDFSQFLYLHTAFAHYQCHRDLDEQSDEIYGLIDFVLAHFIFPDDHANHDDHGHDELPLQQFNQGLQCLAVALMTAPSIDDALCTTYGSIAFVDKFYGCDYFKQIEHPPSPAIG